MAKSELINNDTVTLRVSEEIVEQGEKVLDAASSAVEAVENTVERVVTVTRNNPWLIGAAFVVGAAVGGFAVYKIVSKKLEVEYSERAQEEIAQAKDYYKRVNKAEEFSTPESTAAVLRTDGTDVGSVTEMLSEHTVPHTQYNKFVPEEPAVEEKQTHNVFEDTSDPSEWDWEKEIASRRANPGAPYVINFEEFDTNEEGHEQMNLRYYSGDGVLCDGQDQLVDKVEQTVGNLNLTRFGAGSQDPDIVYIRNERLGVDYEVILDKGSYQHEVLGHTGAELTHSAMPMRHRNRVQVQDSRPRRSRDRDD